MRLLSFSNSGRRPVIIGIAVAVVLIGALIAGFVLLRSTQSPAQRIADAEPPPSPTATAQVEKRVLSVQTTLAGKSESGGGDPVQAPALSDAGKLVVTSLPVSQGATVSAGTVLADISGFPIIAMPGKFPMYRALTEGDSGPDVRQLHTALRQLGFSNADRKGTFGPGTVRAVTKLFKNRRLDTSVLYSASDTAPSDNSEGEAQSAEGSKRPAQNPGAGSTGDGDAAEKTMTIPTGVFSFHSTLPAQVGEVSARVGTVLEDNANVLTLSTAGLRVVAEAPDATAATIKNGMSCTITAPSQQAALTCSVEKVEDGQQEGNKRIILPPADGDELKAGDDVSVAIEVESSGGEVLAVPVTAVRSEPGGASYLMVQAGDGQKRTEVTIGRTIGGWAEITDGKVHEGDTIVLQ